LEVSLRDDPLDSLRSFDTPTICDAIEQLLLRSHLAGFTGPEIRCLQPGSGVMVGYATTVELDYATAGAAVSRHAYAANWLAWLKAMEACPKPGVVVIKEIGPVRRRAALWGDMMGLAAQRLGIVGVVTDGLVRDLPQLERLGMPVFAAGLAASHGEPRVLRVNVPVELDGVRIEPGDLLHGDANGIVNVPLAHLRDVVAVAKASADRDVKVLDYTRSPEFSVDGLFRMRFGK
jgi:4-hydroxy-4-methyl-2-oxoglutarate aldolase